MRALKSPIGVIPRAFRNHRTPEGYAFRVYCLAAQAQWGPLPAVARVTLKEAGRASVELERLAVALEAATARKQRRECARLRKQTFMLREQLARLERRLEELAPPKGPRAHLAAVHQAVAEANRK